MEVLIIGGTRFVGRHIADALAARGHRITLFNRGTNADVHANLKQVHGDRATDLHRLGDGRWDAVIDTSCYTPNIMETSAGYFGERTKRYVFISTISVYDHGATDGPGEDAAVMQLPAEADPAAFNIEYYGALKVLCEQAVQRAFGDRTTILRPGLVAGPFDPTDRFTYWPVRFDEGGEVIAPLASSRVQYVDVRDLANFAVHVCEHDVAGVFNCVTPRGSVTFGDLCQACMHEAAPEDASVVEVSDEFLAEHQVEPWSELPLWIPAASEYAGITNADSRRALNAGMTIRPMHETARDTLAWARIAEKHPGGLDAGLSPEREAELLAAAGHAALK
jgi:2'-hydroxyisoflavone reductase